MSLESVFELDRS